MFDSLFESDNREYDFKNITDKNEISNILNTYLDKYYDINDSKEEWFNKMKELCDELGYASDMKAYKANPEAFKGNVADISSFIRVAVTGKRSSPDMYEVMQILGKDTVIDRINREIARLA